MSLELLTETVNKEPKMVKKEFAVLSVKTLIPRNKEEVPIKSLLLRVDEEDSPSGTFAKSVGRPLAFAEKDFFGLTITLLSSWRQ